MVLIEHRKLNDHSIEVEAPHLASPQRHCEFSTLKEGIVPRWADVSLPSICKPQLGHPSHFAELWPERCDAKPVSA